MTKFERLQMENDRLHSHHSRCKSELGKLVELSNKWRIRAYVTEKLLAYLNKLNPFWYPDDMQKEINLHTEHLFSKFKKREKWWEDMQ